MNQTILTIIGVVMCILMLWNIHSIDEKRRENDNRHNYVCNNKRIDEYKLPILKKLSLENECIKKYAPSSARGFEGIFNSDSMNNYVKCFIKHNNVPNKYLNEGYIYVIYDQNITEVIDKSLNIYDDYLKLKKLEEERIEIPGIIIILLLIPNFIYIKKIFDYVYNSENLMCVKFFI